MDNFFGITLDKSSEFPIIHIDNYEGKFIITSNDKIIEIMKNFLKNCFEKVEFRMKIESQSISKKSIFMVFGYRNKYCCDYESNQIMDLHLYSDEVFYISLDKKYVILLKRWYDLELRSIESGKSIKLVGHKNKLSCVSWSQNGLKVATGSLDGTVRIWNIKTGKQLVIFHKECCDIRVIGWNFNSNYIAYLSNYSLRISTSDKDKEIFVNNDNSIDFFVWSTLDNKIAIIKNSLLLIKSINNRELLSLNNDSRILSLNWNPNNSNVVLSLLNRTIKLIDSINGCTLFLFEGFSFDIPSVFWNIDGSDILYYHEKTLFRLRVHMIYNIILFFPLKVDLIWSLKYHPSNIYREEAETKSLFGLVVDNTPLIMDSCLLPSKFLDS